MIKCLKSAEPTCDEEHCGDKWGNHTESSDINETHRSEWPNASSQQSQPVRENIGETEDTAQWLESRNSSPKTLGSILWQGRVRNSFFCPSKSTLVQTSLCLTPFVCTACTQMCAHVQDPISIYRKRVGLTDGGTEAPKHCTQESKTWVARTMAARFPQGKQPKFSVPCIGTKKLSNQIKLWRLIKHPISRKCISQNDQFASSQHVRENIVEIHWLRKQHRITQYQWNVPLRPGRSNCSCQTCEEEHCGDKSSKQYRITQYRWNVYQFGWSKCFNDQQNSVTFSLRLCTSSFTEEGRLHRE